VNRESVLQAHPKTHREIDDDNLLLDETESKYSKDQGLFNQTLYSMLKTIGNYILSDIGKKKRSFKIGVCTIFIVVTFIMFLKSIVDVAPIAFLKVGQDQGGLFDF